MERTLNALRSAGWKIAQHVDKADGRVQWTMTHDERDPLTIEADNDTQALHVLLRRAGMKQPRNLLRDNGPWIAGVERDGRSRVFIESQDFTHDVRLYVEGDVGNTDDTLAYARDLAAEMNSIQKAPDKAERTPLADRAKSLWTRLSASKTARALGLVAAVIIALVIGALVQPVRTDPRAVEAHADAYIDARTVLAQCPAAAPAVRQAIADGRLTVGEAQQLHDLVQQDANEYESATALAKARSALGMRTDPLPPACDGIRPRPKDDVGPPYDLFQDYVGERE